MNFAVLHWVAEVALGLSSGDHNLEEFLRCWWMVHFWTPLEYRRTWSLYARWHRVDRRAHFLGTRHNVAYRGAFEVACEDSCYLIYDSSPYCLPFREYLYRTHACSMALALRGPVIAFLARISKQSLDSFHQPVQYGRAGRILQSDCAIKPERRRRRRDMRSRR